MPTAQPSTASACPRGGVGGCVRAGTACCAQSAGRTDEGADAAGGRQCPRVHRARSCCRQTSPLVQRRTTAWTRSWRRRRRRRRMTSCPPATPAALRWPTVPSNADAAVTVAVAILRHHQPGRLGYDISATCAPWVLLLYAACMYL